jgi:hypothetical protein
VAVLHNHKRRVVVLEEDHQEVEDPWEDHPSEGRVSLLANVGDLERIPFPRSNLPITTGSPAVKMNSQSMTKKRETFRRGK